MLQEGAGRRALLLGAAGMAAASSAAHAQAWPARSVRVVVGFPPGGPADTYARLLAPELQALWGQPVVVENRPGAYGVIGTEAVARAAPDGHTLLFTATNHTTNAAAFPRLPYDTVGGFTPIAMTATAPTVLIVAPGFPARSLKEFEAYVRAHPGEVGYATSGAGGAGHFAGEMYKHRAALDMPHIPYRGTAAALQDMMGGSVPASFATLTTVLPFIRAGTLRAIAVATLDRVPPLPDTPTFAELGYAGYEANVWYGMLAPANLPRPLVSRIAEDMRAIQSQPAFVKALADQASLPATGGPEEFAALIRREVPEFTAVAREAKITVE
ncbi:Tripartite-type tricarboxylate transporter, receptor component TctC [Roseomonas rosea]|uniref:Tripartite-type tricarboxylate transporter, receptor component TctC n=1 Tax=Muricoccus roseus TaxID=198092 RepID=A0A1M6J072_9PROT|nr:tripartite tricarboxylate transporter substrate binding protein [Roseomonas rosea]SHJ40030.1 Tripartite-type tricarboxylate transporter, receptor component TctC [Roseomonas rosea]